MLYKANFDEVVERYRRLWTGQMQDRIMCKLLVREGTLPRDAFMRNVPRYEQMFEDYLEYCRTKQHVLDDSLPVIAPSFGEGIYGGYLGGTVAFGSGTSWTQPYITDYDQVESLRYDPHNSYMELAKKCMRYYLDNARDRVAVAAPVGSSAGDTAYLGVGERLFVDFYDCPEDVERLMAQLTQFIIDCKEGFWDMGGQHQDGVFYGWMDWWITGRSVMVGADVFCMCSREIFRRFGLPYYQRIIDHFGSGWCHLHNLGLHLLPDLAQLEGLICFEISDDPNVSRRGFLVLDEVRSVLGDIPVQVACRPKEFVDGLERGTLSGNTIYIVCEENYGDIKNMTVDAANRLMDRVRRYRAPVPVGH